MQIRVIVQSRLSSSRLPAKALLPIAGYPSVVLAALRASNLNHEVIVATSQHYSDDPIVSALEQFELNYVRGSLHDVLLRFVQATEDLTDDDVVVRLTADNVFPDGAFIHELVSQYLATSADYLAVSPVESNLPYGLSAEIFSIGLLRKAQGCTTDPFDREHVTPWIDSNALNKVYFSSSNPSRFASLRCTIDTLYDYLLVENCFKEVIDPIRESAIFLCEKLSQLTSHTEGRGSYCTLGTAQLGMNYGIANTVGMLNESEAINIICQAIDDGVVTLDTASAYGKAEERIAKALTGAYQERATIITKLHIASLQNENHSISEINNAVDANIFRSCATLKRNSLDTLLLHDPVDRLRFDGKIWQRLLELKQEGFIKKLGISVYSIEDAILGLQEPHIQHIQLPLNLLDQRWKKTQLEEYIARRPEVEIFVRSALLQGVLILSPDKWPQISPTKANELENQLNGFVQQFNRESIIDLCFAYLRSIPWISSIVVGVDSIIQWNENCNLFKNPLLTMQQMQIIEDRFVDLPEEFLSPSKWNIK